MVERFHSTLAEIARCLKIEKQMDDTAEVILLATTKYNRTIHSMTNKMPIEIIHSYSAEFETEISTKTQQAQEKSLDQINKNRICKKFQLGDKVFLKSNKRLGNKLSPLCSEEIIEADLGTSVFS